MRGRHGLSRAILTCSLVLIALWTGRVAVATDVSIKSEDRAKHADVQAREEPVGEKKSAEREEDYVSATGNRRGLAKDGETTNSAILDLQEDLVVDGELEFAKNRNSSEALRYFRMAAIFGHSGAMATTGIILVSGDEYVERDIPKGIRWLRMAMERGQPDAHAFWGTLHASGVADRYGIEKSLPKAILHWTFAVKSGSILGNIALGYHYLRGIGVPKSCEIASRHYMVAARSAATDPRKLPSLENMISDQPPLPSGLVMLVQHRLTDDVWGATDGGGMPAGDIESLAYYRHSAARGDVDAMVTVGALQLHGGYGIEPDVPRARIELEQAAALGHGEAHGILGHLALKQGDNASAFHHFTRSVASASDMGFYGLGMMHLFGVEPAAKNSSIAAEYFREAVERQHADAAYLLGVLHFRGEGVEQSQLEAFRYFQTGARFGQIQAKMNLGVMLVEGRQPATPNCEQGIEYLKEVAESGEWETVLGIGMDDAYSGNMYSALYRYMQAAHAGIEVAQYNAALILEREAQVRQDPRLVRDETWHLLDSYEGMHWDTDRLLAESLEYYQMSASEGYAKAIQRAGDVAYSAIGDMRRAVAVYERGYSMRDAESTFSLGWMYARGLGVPASRDRAVQLFEKSKMYSPDAAPAANMAIGFSQAFWWACDVLDVDSNAVQFKRLASIFDALKGVKRGEIAGLLDVSSDLLLVVCLIVVLGITLYARRKRIELLPDGDGRADGVIGDVFGDIGEGDVAGDGIVQ